MTCVAISPMKKTRFISFLRAIVVIVFNSSTLPIDGGSISSFTMREQPVEMTTSVVIPCAPQHFKHVLGLLHCYEHQTCPPDQVVISLSQIERANPEEIAQVENTPWVFDLKLLKHRGMKSPGENRTLGGRQSYGDIILFQDADDIPHPQRVEIVKFLFENYYIDHLLHGFFIENDEYVEYAYEYLDHLRRAAIPGYKDYPFYKPEWIELQKYEDYEDLWGPKSFNITNGNPCISREVMNKIKWDSSFEIGEDGRFNRKVYKQFHNHGLARGFLYMYRKTLSSFREENSLK